MVAVGKRGSRMGLQLLRALKRQAQSNNDPLKGRPAPVMTSPPSPAAAVAEAGTESQLRTTSDAPQTIPSTTTSSSNATHTPTPNDIHTPTPNDMLLPPVQTLSSPPPVIYTSAPDRAATPARDNVGNAIGIVFGALACALTIGFIMVICTVRRRRSRKGPAARSKATEPPPPYCDKPIKHLSALMPPLAPLHTPMAELSAQSPAIPGPQELAVPSPIKTSDRPASPWPFKMSSPSPVAAGSSREPAAREWLEVPSMPPASFVLQPPPKTLLSRISRYSARYSKRSTGLTMLDEMQFSAYCKLSGGAKSPISDKANQILGKRDEPLARPAPAFKKVTSPKSPFKMLGRFPTRDEWKRGKVASGYCP